jgi:hypothetical protein
MSWATPASLLVSVIVTFVLAGTVIVLRLNCSNEALIDWFAEPPPPEGGGFEGGGADPPLFTGGACTGGGTGVGGTGVGGTSVAVGSGTGVSVGGTGVAVDVGAVVAVAGGTVAVAASFASPPQATTSPTVRTRAIPAK